ncbi:peptidase M64 [candidate division KSB1 bacterium]|nr:MAG: peptidase M64 [candidate division KSB1 bacterium]
MFKTFFLLIFLPALIWAQVDFQKYFADSTLRIDYYHIGNQQKELITIDQMYLQKFWAGPETKLIDPFNNGKYYVEVFDSSEHRLLFSKGFNTYFGEYQTTEAAKKGEMRTYHETALIPWPKQPVVFKLYSRDRQNILHPIFTKKLVPGKFAFINENRAAGVRVIREHTAGGFHHCVDIAIISEGYTKKGSIKFQKDLKRFTKVLLNKPPFSRHKNQINIYGLFKPSAEAGCDQPTQNIYRNTLLSCTFNSMGSPRYLLTEDNRTLHDVASAVPYDALIIMVNSKRYGGGGIYNFFMDFTTDNTWSPNVMVHEFGHSFAGLADEYYSSSTAYDEFYPPGVEPTEPNITRLLDPKNIKWKQLVDTGVPIPTPWRKALYDSLQLSYLKGRKAFNDEIARLVRSGAPKEVVEAKRKEAAAWSKKCVGRLKNFFKEEKYYGKVGAFEGAGYVSQGMYRPMLDCVMFQNGDKPYCRVCAHRIEEIIRHLTE